MNKYIDIEQLFKCETCSHSKDGKCDTVCTANEFYHPDITKLECRDVQPVKRGWWVPFELETGGGSTAYGSYIIYRPISWRCSECNRVVESPEPHCHCGAQMEIKNHG